MFSAGGGKRSRKVQPKNQESPDSRGGSNIGLIKKSDPPPGLAEAGEFGPDPDQAARIKVNQMYEEQ